MSNVTTENLDRLYEAYRNGRLSRRRFLKYLGLAGASIGLIGSATKFARFRSRLSALGHPAERIARITCPIGDPDLGKEPKAIALGVARDLLHLARANRAKEATA